MSNVSLTANILTSKVNTGNADRLRTYRIQDPSAQMCPVWNGQDLAGRQSSEYGFYTKVEGCNSAEDRIAVENTLRPQYTNFVTYNAEGIAGYIYDKPLPGDVHNLQRNQELHATNERRKTKANNGQFGVISPAESIMPSSMREELSAVTGGLNADAVAAMAQQNRNGQNAVIGYNSQRRFNQYGQGTNGTMISPTQYDGRVNVSNEIPAPRGLSYVPLRNIKSYIGEKHHGGSQTTRSSGGSQATRSSGGSQATRSGGGSQATRSGNTGGFDSTYGQNATRANGFDSTYGQNATGVGNNGNYASVYGGGSGADYSQNTFM